MTRHMRTKRGRKRKTMSHTVSFRSRYELEQAIKAPKMDSLICEFTRWLRHLTKCCKEDHIIELVEENQRRWRLENGIQQDVEERATPTLKSLVRVIEYEWWQHLQDDEIDPYE